MTKSRRRLFDVFPESVHPQLIDLSARCDVSAADLSLAQRMGALHAVSGRIRRKDRFVDQGIGYFLLAMAAGVSMVVVGSTNFSDRSEVIQTLVAVGSMGISILFLLGSFFTLSEWQREWRGS